MAQEGNNNAAKSKREVTDALRRVVTQNPEKIQKACEKVLDDAVEGNLAAFNVIADRLDGRPIQAIEGTGAGGELIIKFTTDDENLL